MGRDDRGDGRHAGRWFGGPVSAAISRPRAVTVRFVNEDGAEQEQDFVGIWATSVQHQIDHLNGRMYFDNLSKVKRDMLIKKARKLVR